MTDGFKPFADDGVALTIGGLTLENGPDRVSLSGSLDLAHDRQALDQAHALRTALDAIIAALDVDKALPAKAPPAHRARTTKAPNPFA